MRAFRAASSSTLILFAASVMFAFLSSTLRSEAQSGDNTQLATSNLVVSRPLITEPLDEAQLTALKGNTHPLARPEFDLGTAPASLPMKRMLLVLKRSPEQEAALRKLLDDQQDKGSPHYHKWLKPEEFGKQFGPTDSDLQTIALWLQSHGFQVSPTKGRTVIEFSGSASQVQEAFHTSIHKYLVNGKQHWANASDPAIPTALTGAVGGVLTLHNFLKKPHVHISEHPVAAKVRSGKKPEITFSGGTHAMGPQDYAVIYNSPAFNGGVTGSGLTIGIVGRSNLFSNGADIDSFRSVFNCCGNFGVVVNGPDPGDLGGGEEAEATLDTTWAGAVAPGARADLVVSASTNTTDGIDLSEVYIIENNFADIMTESFGTCEANFTSSDAAGVSALAEQAAAQGITYFVSSGDSGAEGCDDPNSETVATLPVSVNLLASTPFNIAVGGTMFNENGKTTYWSSTNTNQESALSYIPEGVWNESCTAATCTNGNAPNIWAGSGGASVFFAKPSWQAGVGLNIPNDGARDLPDVSLTSAGHDPYLLCLEGSCVPDAQGNFFIYAVWGTSAAAPSFAGVAALVDEHVMNLGLAFRQGQINYVLYQLAAQQVGNNYQCNGSSTTTPPDLNRCTFNDITTGNNAVPGEINYGLPAAQYRAVTGFDLATGLGSPNITNLVNNWNSVTFNPTTTSLLINGSTNALTIAHGTPVSVSVSVAPNTGTVIPTGDVMLIAYNAFAWESGVPLFTGSGQPAFTLSGGTLSASTSSLPAAPTPYVSPTPYFIIAYYAGDGTFARSNSPNPGIQVTVTPENSTTTVSQFDQNGNRIPLGTTLPFGTAVFVRADVIASSRQGVPTGMVTFADICNGTPCNLPGPIFNPVLNPVPLNSQGNTSIGAGVINFDAGSHSISAAYGSDPSFNASNSTQPATFTIQPGFAGISGPTNVTIASPGLSGTTSVGIITSSGLSPITFTCAGLPSEAACVSSPFTGSGPNTIAHATITITTPPHTRQSISPNAATMWRKY